MKTKPSPNKSQLRIIGGQYKRRMLDFVAVDELRPTPDRLRETLFNWLMHDLQDACVLDVCAGSGALGFEALSRGAAQVTLIEYHKTQSNQLTQNAQKLQTTQAHIIHGDCLRVLPTLTGVFHVVFIDPPYAHNLWQPIIDTLCQHALIDTHTLLYIESDRPLSHIIHTPLHIHKQTRIGQIFAYLCQIV